MRAMCNQVTTMNKSNLIWFYLILSYLTIYLSNLILSHLFYSIQSNPIHPSSYLSICLSIYRSIYLSIYLSILVKAIEIKRSREKIWHTLFRISLSESSWLRQRSRNWRMAMQAGHCIAAKDALEGHQTRKVWPPRNHIWLVVSNVFYFPQYMG